MTLTELSTAQDDLNTTIQTAVQSFIDTYPDAVFAHGNVYVVHDQSGPRVVAVTSIEASVDGARITRRAPENA